MITSANRYLTEKEMQGNAEFITSYFRVLGWSYNAIAAMLGNMESESTINPGIYESLDDTSTSNGFGLVQWTPNTKYKTWADDNGYGSDYGSIVGQVHRIKYELENGLQWIPTDSFPLSFSEFSKSTASPEYLANAFLYNYERPRSLVQPNRATQARKWYEYIITAFNIPVGDTRKRSLSKLLLYSSILRR